MTDMQGGIVLLKIVRRQSGTEVNSNMTLSARTSAGHCLLNFTKLI